MQLTKTNFLHFLECQKSFWLLKHKPSKYIHKEVSTYDDKLAYEGYEVQKLVQDFLMEKKDKKYYSFEVPFKTDDKLYASADIIYQNPNGDIDVYEVKSSGSIDKSNLIDAAFQTITIEKSGKKVNSIYIVHLNKDYVRGSSIKVEEMMVFSLVTDKVRKIIEETYLQIKLALNMLKKTEIDEDGCSCLKLSRTHHCDTFDFFNPNIPSPSIYNLPRISKKKLNTFVNESRFNLNDVDESELTGKQISVLKSAKSRSPIIDKKIIKKFFQQIQYPVYFLDYETYSSAIPIIEGVKPHSHIPFQFSIHVKHSENSSNLKHFEYLSGKIELPLKMIEYMEKIIATKGSVVCWHKSFENTRNKEMGILYPKKDSFLKSIINRTIDLEDIFKEGYVDIAFQGSTSIKKVLPVIISDLNYDNIEVSNGTDAMEAFKRIIDMPNGTAKNKLRNDMLEYCKLDTLAMVKIFEKIKILI